MSGQQRKLGNKDKEKLYSKPTQIITEMLDVKLNAIFFVFCVKLIVPQSNRYLLYVYKDANLRYETQSVIVILGSELNEFQSGVFWLFSICIVIFWFHTMIHKQETVQPAADETSSPHSPHGGSRRPAGAPTVHLQQKQPLQLSPLNSQQLINM